MSQTFQARLQSINRTMLTPLVRQALNNSTAEILDWDQHILAGGTGREVLSVVHFSGSAQMQNEVMPWSLVLKAISGTHESASADIHAWNYWKREVLVYQSGLLSDLDGDMVAPHCFGVVEYPNQEYWIWLEYIQEDKVVWPLERYQLAARHLGQFNGSYYLVGSSLQGYPWLTRGHLRQHLALGEPGLQKLQNLSRHPRSWVTVDTTERTVNLYANRERLLNHIDHLPHCFCHFDAFRRNLRSRQSGQGKDQTMLIDWSAAGLGAIGEEIATLVVISLLFLEVPSKDMTRLNTLAVEGYLAGLREAGWNGNEDDVRFAYTASAAILALSLTGILLPGIEDDEQCIRWEQSSGYPLDVILSQLRELHQLALDLGEEAQTLLKWLVS